MQRQEVVRQVNTAENGLAVAMVVIAFYLAYLVFSSGKKSDKQKQDHDDFMKGE